MDKYNFGSVYDFDIYELIENGRATYFIDPDRAIVKEAERMASEGYVLPRVYYGLRQIIWK